MILECIALHRRHSLYRDSLHQLERWLVRFLRTIYPFIVNAGNSIKSLNIESTRDKLFSLHFRRAPSDLKFIFATNRSPLADNSSPERHFNITTAHNRFGFLQSILQNVHHTDIEEIEAASCEKGNEKRRKD